MESAIHHQLIQLDRVGHEMDLFFPTPEYVQILERLLTIGAKKITSAQLTEPTVVAKLGSLSGINSDIVSEADIIRMRMDDELFENWRSTLRRILQRIHDDENHDVEREVIEVARDEIRTWNMLLENRVKKSSVLTALKDASARASIGFIAGLYGGKDLNHGIVAGTVTGASWFIWGSIQGAKDRERVRLARQHFLALGL